ncbi:MAG: hypothetical protein ABI353_16905 [Isosphaeraceae bacterium]
MGQHRATRGIPCGTGGDDLVFQGHYAEPLQGSPVLVGLAVDPQLTEDTPARRMAP